MSIILVDLIRVTAWPGARLTQGPPQLLSWRPAATAQSTFDGAWGETALAEALTRVPTPSPSRERFLAGKARVMDLARNRRAEQR